MHAYAHRSRNRSGHPDAQQIPSTTPQSRVSRTGRCRVRVVRGPTARLKALERRIGRRCSSPLIRSSKGRRGQRKVHDRAGARKGAQLTGYAAFEECCPRSLGVRHFVSANGRARHEHRDSWVGTPAPVVWRLHKSETDLEDRAFSPTFILGAAHSGTTILYRMLALHPEVLWFSQFSLRSGEIAGRWSLPFNDANRQGAPTIHTT